MKNLFSRLLNLGRLVTVVTVTFLVAGIGSAYAAYDLRSKEIRTLLVTAGVADGSNSPLNRSDSYGRERAKALADLVEVLSDCDGDGDCEWKWKAIAAKMISSAETYLRGKGGDEQFYPGQEPSSSINELRARILSEETTFWRTVRDSSGIAEDLDSVIELRELLEEQRKSLEAKWAEIARQDARVDSELEQVADAVSASEAAHREAAGKGSEIVAKVREFLSGLTEAFGRAKERLPSDGSALGNLESAVLTIAVYAADTNLNVTTLQAIINSKLGRLNDAMNSQRNLALLFLDIRAGLDRFLDENNNRKLSELESRMATSLDRFTKAGGSLREQLDGAEMRNRINPITQDRVGDAQDAWTDLITQEQGRFLGDVSDAILEELLESTYWRDFENRLEIGEYRAELREQYGTIRRLADDAQRLVDQFDDQPETQGMYRDLYEVVQTLREAERLYASVDRLAPEELLNRYFAERDKLESRLEND